MNQTRKNFLYSLMYQILVLILPIITAPYVSRVLGAKGVGIYSYSYSIVYYFMLLGLLGINNYGNRIIAKCRHNKEKLSKTFLSIYTMQIIMNTLAVILYILYISLFNPNYINIALIQMIYLLSNAFDINWFFFGIEKFKLTVTRNLILKILSLVLIFLFVKTSNDVWLYTLILAVSTLVSQIYLFTFLRKEIKLVRIKLNDILDHIKPCLILFIPVIATSIYKIMDKIMIGLLSNVTEVGYYEQGEKIINISLGVVTALGTVMLPRISNLVSNKEYEKIKQYIKKSFKFMMFMALPICFGLIAISSDFIPIFLGESFTKTSILIYYLSFTILFISFGNVIKTQYILPFEKDKIYTISVITGAIINLICNLIFIPLYASIGACIGTIAAELFVMIFEIYIIRNKLPIKDYLKDIYPIFIKAIIMFVSVLLIKLLPISAIYKVLIQVVIGISIYGLLNYKYIMDITNIKNVLKKKVIK